MRSVIAVALGLVVSIAGAWAGAIVVLLVTMGIPLGAEARDPSAAALASFLGLSAAAAWAGGRTAAATAPQSRAVVPLLCAILAGLMIWGFWGSPGWPAWWGAATGATMAAGAWMGNRRRR